MTTLNGFIVTDGTPRTMKKRYRVGIRIDRCDADPNDLAWSTLMWLGNTHAPVGEERLVVELFKMAMRNRPPGMTIYANPVVRVTAANPSREFLTEARRQQRRWIKQLNTWLFRAGRVKRYYASASPIVRQLEFTGVLILDGSHVRPDQWPKLENLDSSATLAGRRFGRLTVIEELPEQMCRCHCQCGRTTLKRLKHLVASRTKSCGCLRDENIEANQRRKETRAGIHSGEIRHLNQ